MKTVSIYVFALLCVGLTCASYKEHVEGDCTGYPYYQEDVQVDAAKWGHKERTLSFSLTVSVIIEGLFYMSNNFRFSIFVFG